MKMCQGCSQAAEPKAALFSSHGTNDRAKVCLQAGGREASLWQVDEMTRAETALDGSQR